MVKKPTHLRFTEDDLSDAKVQKAADHAEKAADRLRKLKDLPWQSTWQAGLRWRQ